MWMRWAEDVEVTISGVDATIHRPNGDLFLRDGGELITRLQELLSKVKSTTVLEEELGRHTSAVGARSLLRDLTNNQVLQIWELGPELAKLHQVTVEQGDYPVLSPSLETARILRETEGSHGISLPDPRPVNVSLSTALTARRTCRRFFPASEPVEQLGNILGMAISAGVTDSASPMMPGGPAANRAYPSGGGLYPVEVIIYPTSIADVPPAFYYYQALAHRMIRVAPPIPDSEVKRLLANHPVEGASFFVFLYLDFMRVGLSRYGMKAYRLALLEAGHIAQCILLSATAAGLGTLPLCGFDDRHLSQAAGLSYPEEAILYSIAIGRQGGHAHEP